jgi:hypothetical protein
MSQEIITVAIPVLRECPKCGWIYCQWVNITRTLISDRPALVSFISSAYKGISDNPKFKEHDCKGEKK